MKNALYLSLGLLAASCSSNPEQAATTAAAPAETAAAAPRELPEVLRQALEAHGGLAAWQQFGTMEYQMKSTLGTPRDEKHLIDLRTRQVRIEAPGYQLGLNDANQVWVTPNKAAFGEMSPRFYHNLFFYFFSIPFVLADAGTVYEDLGTRTVAGKTYQALKVSYETGRGDSSKDEYIAHFNPQTHRLELLLYTVTFFEPGKKATYNSLLYTDWQTADGLVLPAKMEGHKFENDQIGDLRYQAEFSNVHLTRAQPAASLFAMPKGAEVDSLKQ
ncbi:DUF6503 family protein [Hymenobacter rubripertinctus]|uniref:Outer membrane lipoprotein-sorting protein n=1 Tax=Hymenobacter rubripertinctus TaxID=2029981 RepID=A0A418RA09_9BACT|nr:DUF6503 family protein [Hymenobacter rubripertinctus]RIY14303.1 hypothetical protein D0T11_01050 [Hymenobacter rubripertinctus]